MANEITVPLLPCRDIDEMIDFYQMLGFTRRYRQVNPNPYISMKREDLQLDFFGMPDFKAEDSYGTCVVLVSDTGALFEAFAEGMRAVHGKLLVSGIPRMTRPRRRKNAGNLSGFSVIDPGGNWIRFFAAKGEPVAQDPAPKESPEQKAARSKLAASLRSAVVMGDSHGVDEQAIRILDSSLRRHDSTAPAVDLLEALAYRAELAVRVDDLPGARDFLARAGAVPLTEAERAAAAEALAGLDDLAGVLNRQ